MQSDDMQAITRRFFDALARLKADGAIRGKKTFTDRFGVNRWNLNSVEKDPTGCRVSAAWLSYLVIGYNVSADWLLTGRGDFYGAGRRSK